MTKQIIPNQDDAQPVIVREDGQLPGSIEEIDAAHPQMITAGTDLLSQCGRLVSIFSEPPAPPSFYRVSSVINGRKL